MTSRRVRPAHTRSPARHRRNSTAAQYESVHVAPIMWLRPSGVFCSVDGGHTSWPSA